MHISFKHIHLLGSSSNIRKRKPRTIKKAGGSYKTGSERIGMKKEGRNYRTGITKVEREYKLKGRNSKVFIFKKERTYKTVFTRV